MERLTDKESRNPICSEQGGLCVSAKFVRRLAAYEDVCFDVDGKERITVEELSALVKAQGEGRAFTSPVAIEQKIYKFSPLKSGVLEWMVIRVMKSKRGFDFEVISYSGMTHRFSDEAIGKTVFLAHAEAEAALSGGGGDG